MRAPLVLLIGIFAVAAAGLAVIPGQDADGNPAHMSIFDAFYFMSYTATTIGFGELAAAFTIPQRMWVTAAIYSQVIGWAYSIGTLFSLLQDPSFQDAIATGRFRRRVRRLSEPFLIVSATFRSPLMPGPRTRRSSSPCASTTTATRRYWRPSTRTRSSCRTTSWSWRHWPGSSPPVYWSSGRSMW